MGGRTIAVVGYAFEHPIQVLIVGGFYSEVVLQKREAEGTVRTKHQLNLDPNPGGTQKILDDRRYGGREEQRIPHVGGGAGAAQGVTGHLRALGDRTGCTVTNDGASVPEVLTPTNSFLYISFIGIKYAVWLWTSREVAVTTF